MHSGGLLIISIPWIWIGIFQILPQVVKCVDKTVVFFWKIAIVSIRANWHELPVGLLRYALVVEEIIGRLQHLRIGYNIGRCIWCVICITAVVRPDKKRQMPFQWDFSVKYNNKISIENSRYSWIWCFKVILQCQVTYLPTWRSSTTSVSRFLLCL